MSTGPDALRAMRVGEVVPRLREADVERCWERAYRFAAMVTRNGQDADDIAQEALLRAIRKLSRFDPSKGTFESWLWRIVLNVARDAGRASMRRASLLERLRREPGAERAEAAEAVVLARLTDTRLLEAVRGLRKKPRTLIALRFGARLSYKEIGAQLGISEGAAAQATRRAILLLGARLKEEG
ncbi:MAG: RNA polymerase sigma factor [Candidatus Dormibacterales bacterium]